MNKTEGKYRKTAIQMNQALLQLLETKDFSAITVRELCETAGVNRSTFYLHYESIYDLLTETIDQITISFRKSFQISGKKLQEEIPALGLEDLLLCDEEMLIPYLEFVRSNQAVVRAAYHNPEYLQVDVWMEYIRTYVLEPILVRFDVPKAERNYWKSYYMHGTQAIIQEWLKGGCRESVEEIEGIIHRCIRPDFDSELRKQNPDI